MKGNSIIFLLYYFVYCASSQPTLQGMCNITFDPKNFIVYFAPWVQEAHVSEVYDAAGLIPMIRTISTRFSTLEAPSITSKEMAGGKHSHIHIPIAVATFNNLQVSNDSGTGLPPTLRVMLTWKVTGNGSSSEEEKMSSFNTVKKLADSANTIYPGTVTSLTLLAHNVSENDAERMTQQMRHAKSAINNSTFPYELGIMLRIGSCESVGKWLRGFLRQILWSDYMLLTIHPGQEDFSGGVDKTVEAFTQRYAKCKKMLHSKNPSLKVGLRVSWSDTTGIEDDGKKDISSLIRFWAKMNNFAGDTNTSVVMVEAFDQPFRMKDGHQGWWLLNNTIPYWSSADYKFEEKCAQTRLGTIPHGRAFNNNATPNEPNRPVDPTTKPTDETEGDSTKTTKEDSWGMSEIGTTLTVVLVGMLLLAIFFVYWKLRRDMNANKVNDDDINEFYEGRPGFPDDNSYGQVNKAETFAYDKSYDIPSSSFRLDESVPLGSGEFGFVCLGKVKTADLELQSAVKVAKKNSAVALKSLMCEIKILSHIGVHDNIVRLIGAYTAELKKGKLMLFLELCPHGSLLKYLRRYSDTMSREVMSYLKLTEGENTSNMRASNCIDTHLLVQWCRDILKGMAYLASKSLVHADLATRNVLLDRERRAKICDFGLSRRLYNYSSYVKSKAEPMPWRWMSPESLRRLEFNEKTDVWAFGVTVWEIFSYGDVPYPGLSWTADFPMRLEAGVCLQQPSSCPSDLFEKILHCWSISPLTRPTFSQLEAEFLPILETI